ncbi:MAG TPA: polysaccharide biosynthesis/export family protein [Flavisolibacter sp.]|nr:polysaccharide biosynthesis/export family protein [Flavisolibacter sp.]
MRIYLSLICLITITSCGSQKRATYNYLEDIKDTSFKKSVFMTETIIQKSDLLSIQIYSASADSRADQLYNMPILNSSSSNNQQLQGYLVDQRGNIEYPRLGLIHAEGLSKPQLADTIKARLQGQLAQPTVVVRFLNFRITVLGEVGNPGVLTIPTERLSILEAVGMAGGVTQYGKIKEIKVLRENNGIRELGVLDLTSKNIFSSPYYQLQQNDVVLVDQTSFKLRQTEQQRITQQIGFALTIVTSIALLYSIFKK